MAGNDTGPVTEARELVLSHRPVPKAAGERVRRSRSILAVRAPAAARPRAEAIGVDDADVAVAVDHECVSFGG